MPAAYLRAFGRKGMAIRMKKQLLPLLTAALCCTAFVGCGNDHTADRGAETTSTRRSTTTSTTATTETTSRTTDSTLRSDMTDGMTNGTADSSAPDIIDRAESMLDDAKDTVTSVLTEATREVH